jgi:2-dehydro-3-deoxy-D-arabinonate dehydratase
MAPLGQDAVSADTHPHPAITVPLGHLARVLDEESGRVVIGVTDDAGVVPLLGIEEMSQLLELDRDGIAIAMSNTGQPIPFNGLRFLPPIDGATEVWAAGVTYLVSREAREEESGDREVYRRVYDASRPELFFKGPAWRAVTDGEPIGIRDDSPNNVPEPEVGLVLNAAGELVGLTVVDDVSSRTIEGENPLYLPQAKIYDGCCALGRSIAPANDSPDHAAIQIKMTITRNGEPVFAGESSTRQMKRNFDELARYLFRQMSFPQGVVLATGTSVVPPMTTALDLGDVVDIEVSGLGRMVTPVAPASEVGSWLVERRLNPRATFDGRLLDGWRQ